MRRTRICGAGPAKRQFAAGSVLDCAAYSQALQEGEDRVGEPVPAWAGPRSPLPASRCHPGAGRRSRQPATRGGRAGPTLGSGDLRGAVPAQLLELGGRGAGGLVSALRGGLGGGGVVAGGFCLGDLGADGGRVQARGLVPGGAGQNGGLADQGVEGGQRVLVADGGAGRSDAGAVVVAAGAVGAAELAGAAAGLRGGQGPAAGTLAGRLSGGAGDLGWRRRPS